MHNEGFQYCCGAEELGPLHDMTTKSLEAFLQNERSILEDLESADYFPAGAYIATTVPAQRTAIRALKANKFKQVFTFTNPGTQNRVTLWARKLVR